MDPGLTIGILAVFTIGSVLLLILLQGGSFLRDPKNRFHLKNVFSRYGKSATATAEARAPAGTTASLKSRLDGSIASQHPIAPGEQTQASRMAKFNSERRG